MEISDLLRYYLKLKEIMNIVEAGTWRDHKATNNLSIDQVEKIKEAVTIFEQGKNRIISPPRRVD